MDLINHTSKSAGETRDRHTACISIYWDWSLAITRTSIFIKINTISMKKTLNHFNNKNINNTNAAAKLYFSDCLL